MSDPAAGARAVIDANHYMTLGTADDSGHPWVTPVWFAPADYREFFWVSSPAARHSRNIAIRSAVSIVIFDSQVPVGSAAAVYMTAVAQELTGTAQERGLEVFARESEAQGLSVWGMANVTAPARHRLYRAAVTEQWVLDPHDERLPVTLAG
jgi:nitroimidazol reductase NimA-like FMN-containing flavoprotein (pyridoxamine 5'-phosphate oxidase superfamily)